MTVKYATRRGSIDDLYQRADEDLHRLAGKRERAPAAKRGKPSGRMPAPEQEASPDMGSPVLELIRLFHRESMRPHIEAQTGFWDEEAQRRRMLASDPEAHEIIEVDGRPVGCCLVRTTDEAIRLVRMYLMPSHQGLGIGSAFLRDLCDRADDCQLPIILRILKVNPAQRLYEKFGFETTDETDTHYHMTRRPVSAKQEGNTKSKSAMGQPPPLRTTL